MPRKKVTRVRPEVAVTGRNVERFVRMLRSQAWRLAKAERLDLDDARQEIAIWIMEALGKFDARQSPLRQWVRLYVTRKVIDRVEMATALKRRPTTYSYDQCWGWTRTPYTPNTDPEDLENIEAEPGSQAATTPEDEYLEAERNQRFQYAIGEAEHQLLERCSPLQAETALKVFRIRIDEARSTGLRRRVQPRETVAKLGITSYEERRLWLQGRQYFRLALRCRGELGAPERVRIPNHTQGEERPKRGR